MPVPAKAMSGVVNVAGTPEIVLTPDLVESIYGVNVLIDREPTTGVLRVTYLAATLAMTVSARRRGLAFKPT
jgi:iron complex transport system ATP-binding protein